MKEPPLEQMRNEIVFIGDGDLSDMPAERVRWYWRQQNAVLQKARMKALEWNCSCGAIVQAINCQSCGRDRNAGELRS